MIRRLYFMAVNCSALLIELPVVKQFNILYLLFYRICDHNSNIHDSLFMDISVPHFLLSYYFTTAIG